MFFGNSASGSDKDPRLILGSFSVFLKRGLDGRFLEAGSECLHVTPVADVISSKQSAYMLPKRAAVN